MTESRYSVLTDTAASDVTRSLYLGSDPARIQSQGRLLNSLTVARVSQTKRSDWSRVAPLVYSHLRERGMLDRLDPDVRSFFLQQYQRNLCRNTLMAGAAADAVRMLRRHGIGVLLLKSSTYLSDQSPLPPGAYVLSDVDLLVAPDSAASVDALLLEAGYQRFHQTRDGRQIKSCYQRKGGLDIIDIHTALFWAGTDLHYSDLIDLDLRAGMPAQVGGELAQVLSPADQICVMLVHDTLAHGIPLLIHDPARLYAFCRLLDHWTTRLDWPVFLPRLERSGFLSLLAAYACLAEQRLGWSPPKELEFVRSRATRHALYLELSSLRPARLQSAAFGAAHFLISYKAAIRRAIFRGVRAVRGLQKRLQLASPAHRSTPRSASLARIKGEILHWAFVSYLLCSSVLPRRHSQC